MNLTTHKFAVSVLMSDGRGTVGHHLYVFDAVSADEAMGMAARLAFAAEPRLPICGMQCQQVND